MYGKAIKEARIQSGYTQLQVANTTGLPQNTISWIELDKGVPNIDYCVKLAKFYGCTLDELVGLSDYNPTNNAPMPTQQKNSLSTFDNEFSDILTDNNFLQTARLFKAISPELRALALGYIVGLLQNNNVNTKNILGY